MYLDADTEVVADISFLFQLLEDGWSVVFCTNPAQYVLAREMRRPDNQDECDETFKLMGSDEMLQLNGGVFAFRRHEETERFFRAWHQEWCRYGKRDQAALNRVLYGEPIRLYVLGNAWNTIKRYLDRSITAGILHYPLSARRWRGVLNGRLDSSEAWAAVHPETMPKDRK
jgi:lipopolysaccharide biosynthesis glycosyltransferase